MEDFINEYGIHAKASLLVELYVKVSGSKNKYDESLTKNAVLSLRIPLVEDTSENQDRIVRISEMEIFKHRIRDKKKNAMNPYFTNIS